jgi:pimeloyl-ACP methyl ester carboxylesterase
MTTSEGPIFAWHHPPAGAARDAVVVLCRPFGYEAQCTQRAYRHLAERLSDAGFHALRIDYHGTGDSSGGDADDDRLRAWSDSVRAAMEWARASLNVPKVALFGSRFGALVALGVAEQGGVDALALLAPPPSGRGWLREARAFRAMTVAANGLQMSEPPAGGEESAGFFLSHATVDSIGKLAPAASTLATPSILLIARDDLPGAEEKLAAKLRALGAEVTLSQAAGYGAMMHADPRRSLVPHAAWAEITGWLSARYGYVALDDPSASRPTSPSYPRVAEVRETRDAPLLREEAIDMGGLFGIATEPMQPPAREPPTIVLHNTGANSHIGANRMYVTMARRWAALGFRVVRFDIAGLGDSPADPQLGENQVYSDGTAEDSRRAIDFLARTRDARRFVLMGLCSGAFFSFHAALADARVVGIVLLNVQIFHWQRGAPVDTLNREILKSTKYYWKAAFGMDAWLRLVRREVDVRTIAQGALDEGWKFMRHRVGRAVLGESAVARGFRALLRRGTDVLMVLSADDASRNVVDAHLGTDAKHFRGELGFRFEIVDNADHTFSPVACQDALLSLLTNHLKARFAPEPAPMVQSAVSASA